MSEAPSADSGALFAYRVRLVFVYFGLVLAALWVFHVLNEGVWTGARVAEAVHDSVIAGEAPYPHQFRPLVPWVCEAMARAGVPLQGCYLLQRFACWFLAVLVLHHFMTTWLRPELAFGGCAAFIAVLPFSAIGQGFQPTDPLNLLLFVAAYDLLLARRDAWLVPLVAVGMFNRETIALVALLAAFVRLDEWRSLAYWRLVLTLVAVAGFIYLALHGYWGPRESFTPLVTPAQNIPENLTRAGSLRVVVLYGALWPLALVGLGQQPAFLRRSTLLIPIFLAVHLAVGLLGETRYFLPLAPTVIPLALRRLFPEAARELV